MTTNLKLSAKKLADAQLMLKQLREQEQRSLAAINSSADHAFQIEELERQRSEIQGRAFLENAVADTKTIDRQLQEFGKSSESALTVSRAAAAAALILGPQIEAATKRLTAAEEDHQAAIAENLHTIFKDSEDAYHRAATTLKDALARMNAAARLLKTITGAGPVDLVESVITSLVGSGQGAHATNGLVVKNAANQYGYDTDLWVGRLSAQTAAAMSDIRTELTKDGAQL